MKLYARASADERAVMRPMIKLLGSAAGRAQIINSDGAKHEAASSADGCETCVDDTTSQYLKGLAPDLANILFLLRKQVAQTRVWHKYCHYKNTRKNFFACSEQHPW